MNGWWWLAGGAVLFGTLIVMVAIQGTKCHDTWDDWEDEL